MDDLPILIEDSKILLSSFLNESAFGRTDMGQILSEKGVSATIRDGEVSVDFWTFGGTEIRGGTVYYSGEFSDGTLLYEDFSAGNAYPALKCLDYLIENQKILDKNNISLPGAAGIIIGGKSSVQTVLFLPGTLFDRCAQNSKNYGELQGIFYHKGLSGIERNIFLRAVIAYKALSKKYPFGGNVLEKRQADFTDENFIPLEWQIQNVKKEAAESVNAGLKTKAKKRVVPGERRFNDEKFESRRTSLLSKAMEFKSEMIFEAGGTQDYSEDFIIARNAFLKKQKKQIARKRFFSRNKNQITAACVLTMLLTAAAFNFNRENQKLATSAGLTSFETVETLYTGIHKADVTVVQEIAKGRNVKSLIQKVSGFYVTNTQRQTFDEKSGTLSPAQWLFFKGTTDFWQYGITDFKIDGECASVQFEFPRKKDKKQPLTEQNGKKLTKGEKISHEVSYNLVHYDGESVISVNPAKETVFLEWNGRRWIVKNIEGRARSNSYKVKDYKADYRAALEESGGDVKNASDILRQKYEFVPREDEMMAEVSKTIAEFNLQAAKDFSAK